MPFSKKNKEIKVIVKASPQDYTTRCRPTIKGQSTYITLERETDLTPGWEVDITDCVRFMDGIPYVEVLQGASRAVKVDVARLEYNPNQLTDSERDKLIKLKIIRMHYGNILKELFGQIKPWLAVAIGVAAIACVLAGVSAYFSYNLNQIYIPR